MSRSSVSFSEIGGPLSRWAFRNNWFGDIPFSSPHLFPLLHRSKVGHHRGHQNWRAALNWENTFMREERFAEQVFSHSSQDKGSAQLLARIAVTLAFPYPNLPEGFDRRKTKAEKEGGTAEDTHRFFPELWWQWNHRSCGAGWARRKGLRKIHHKKVLPTKPEQAT